MYTKLHKRKSRNFKVVMLWVKSPTVYRETHWFDAKHNIWRRKHLPPTSFESHYREIIASSPKISAFFPNPKDELQLMQYMKWKQFSVEPSNLYARAYDDFLDKVKGERATLIMTLGTMDKTFDMVNTAVNRLSFLTAKNKKQYLAERRRLNKRLNPADRDYDRKQMAAVSSWHKSGMSTKVADGWLMNSYGIQPIVTDLNQFNKIVKEKFDAIHANKPVVGRSFERIAFDKTDLHKNTSYNTLTRHIYNGRAGYEISAKVGISSPMLAFAETMGVLNVGLLANDRIPFSFIVNYWTQHEAYIASLTALAGLTLSDAYTLHYAQGVTDYKYDKVWKHRDKVDSYDYRLFEKHSVRTTGKPRLPGISERVKLVPSTGVKRLLNTAALIRILTSK